MDWIEELYTKVEEHKIELDAAIRCLKELFKPWPLHQSRMVDDVQLQHKPEEVLRDSPVTMVLTTEEQEGVALVDKLLSKAQRAMAVQKKLEGPGKVKDSANTLKQQKQSVSKDKQSSASRQIKSENPANSLPGQVSTASVEKTATLKIRENLNDTDKMQKTNINSSKKLGTSVTVPHLQSSSGCRKVVPAHASAPFQTDPKLISRKLQTTYRASTAKTQSKWATSRSEVNVKPVNSVIASRKELGNEQIKYKKSNSLTDDHLHTIEKPYTAATNCISASESNKKLTNCEVLSNCTSADSPAGDITKNCALDMNLDKLLLGDAKVPVGSMPSVTFEDKNASSMGLNLASQSSTLAIPPKLKRLLAQKRKLQQKLYAHNVTQKVQSHAADNDFLSSIERTFMDEGSRCVQVQARQAECILHRYKNMSSLLNSLHLNHISGDSVLEDIYRSKKLLEFILQTFQETKELLKKHDFSLLKMAKLYPGDCRATIPVPEYHSVSLWYKTPYQGLSSAASYKNYQQLERYTHTLYKVQLLQLQCDIIDTTAGMVLPLLQLMDPNSSEFASVLRAGFSLMSSNPNNMPVVVKDTIPSDSFCNDEDQQGS